MASTPEELALSLSQATFDAQQRMEAKLRERATNVLSAASIVVPVAAVAVGKGPALVAIPFSGAALAYIWCAVESCAALIPRGFSTGIAGGRFLEQGRTYDAGLHQLEASAAVYLDQLHDNNVPNLENTTQHVTRAIVALMLEISASAVALVATLLT
jgi:hypothetical protein